MWTLTHNLPTNTLRPKAQRKYNNTILVKKRSLHKNGRTAIPKTQKDTYRTAIIKA